MLGESAYIWVSPLVAMISAQVLKPLLIMIRLRRWDVQRMRQSGGMPSSHTALVVALVTELWLRQGGQNPVLAIAIFVAIIVMYDAAGVRWQTGRQAAVLNRLLRDLRGHTQLDQISVKDVPIESREMVRELHPIKVAKAPWWLVDWPILNEHVGHKPSEVIGGCIVGLFVALMLH
jgi:acid phosphatase family membrane protein YuiD